MEIKYKKRTDESREDYIWRICLNKDSEIYSLTWNEVGDILNYELNEDFTSSKWRKNYQMMKKGFDKARKESIEIEGMYEEIEMKKLELKEEQCKLSTLRLDVNKTVRNSSRYKLWLDEIKKHMKEVTVKVPEYKGFTKDVIMTTDEHMLVIADIHAGKKGESLDNYYDLDTLQSRMWKVRDEAINYVRENKITTLKILSLGDLIDGLLRASQIQNLQMLRAKQTIFIARFLFEWLNAISAYCNIEFLMVTSSNHTESRPLDSNRGDFKEDDYELIIYEWLKDLCSRNDRITIFGNDILEFDMCNRKCIAMHGHQLKKVQGKNMLAKVSFHRNKQYQYMFIGHLHHTEIRTEGKNDLGNKETIYCPCICGNDEYSDDLWTGSSAGALLFKFNDKQGRRCITDIIVD